MILSVPLYICCNLKQEFFSVYFISSNEIMNKITTLNVSLFADRASIFSDRPLHPYCNGKLHSADNSVYVGKDTVADESVYG